MTRNQIDYWKYKETQRNNLATEAETERNHRVVEVETNRHNLATERLDLSRIGETIRSNRAQEELQKNQHAIQRDNLAETNRANLAKEGLQNKQIEWGSAIDMAKLGETTRHNQATERYDLASLGEQSRHNQATEYNQAVSNKIEQNKLNESKRQFNQNMEYNEKKLSLDNLVAVWNHTDRRAIDTARIDEINNKIAVAKEQLELAKEMQTYEQIEKATKAIENVATAVNQTTQSAKNITSIITQQ